MRLRSLASKGKILRTILPIVGSEPPISVGKIRRFAGNCAMHCAMNFFRLPLDHASNDSKLASNHSKLGSRPASKRPSAGWKVASNHSRLCSRPASKRASNGWKLASNGLKLFSPRKKIFGVGKTAGPTLVSKLRIFLTNISSVSRAHKKLCFLRLLVGF